MQANALRRLPAGLPLALVIAVAGACTAGVLIGTGRGFHVVSFLLLAVVWTPILVNWERGLYGLLAYVPVAGGVTLALYPERLPLLFKDIFFVVPMYIGFVGILALGSVRLNLPRVPIGLMVALTGLAGIQMLGAQVSGSLMAVIGFKVWVFYLPLYVIAFTAMRSRDDLWRIMRLLTVLTVVPCVVGLMQYALAVVFGYRLVMTEIYGEVAAGVTQRFAVFEIGPGRLFRIPSTFTFVAQYWGFTLAMLVPSYAVWRGDPSLGWRRLGGWVFGLDLAAAALSGARAAFLFVPLLLGMTVFLDRKGVLRMRSLVRIALVLLLTLAVARISVRPLFDLVGISLLPSYATDIAYGGLKEAIRTAPFGAGTGTNTGPARYAFVDPGNFRTIENYYAKAAFELGVPGLLLVVALFIWIVWDGWTTTNWLRGPLRPCAAALTAFAACLALNSFKGGQIDLDPINVYFWVFAGILAKLPWLAASRSMAGGPSSAK